MTRHDCPTTAKELGEEVGKLYQELQKEVAGVMNGKKPEPNLWFLMLGVVAIVIISAGFFIVIVTSGPPAKDKES
jgi:hypothetical protein